MTITDAVMSRSRLHMVKGNLDVTGGYFIWTTNMGGDRLDAFIVKVPANLLMGGQ
jgi:hypothetical protein